ncbi:MAG: transporter, partial [Rikenellaceae bacterium]
EVNKHLYILKVKADAIALYDAQMKISENDFVNGRINIIDLSLERSRRSTAMVTFQESRAALYNAVTLLEMLTKVKIIQK